MTTQPCTNCARPAAEGNAYAERCLDCEKAYQDGLGELEQLCKDSHWAGLTRGLAVAEAIRDMAEKRENGMAGDLGVLTLSDFTGWAMAQIEAARRGE